MSKIKTCAELKAISRNKLLGQYGRLISAMLIVELITTFLDLIATSVTDSLSYGNIIYNVITIIIQLFLGIFTSGSAYLYLNFISDRPYKPSDVFQGFKIHTDKAILLQGLYVITSLLCFLPGTVMLYLIWDSYTATTLMITMVLILIGTAIYAIVLLNFFPCIYMIHDFPDLSIKKILKFGLRKMKGNRLKFLYMGFSFLPLLLVGILSFGIGLLWVMPYMNTAKAHLYLEIMEQ